MDLKEQGAEYEILSGQLCQEHIEKVCDMEVRHNAPHTNGQMKNFAVLFDHGQYQMVANGNIKNIPNSQHNIRLSLFVSRMPYFTA